MTATGGHNFLAAPLKKKLGVLHILCTPYSMNSLFSEFFRKFGGAFLEVCETSSGGMWEVFGGKIKENYPEKIRKNPKNPIGYCKI